MIYQNIRKFIKLPDYFTLAGLICALFSIFLSFKKEFIFAAIFIYVSMAFDFMDGKIARKIKREGRFGVELDNLCDVVLYLIAISVFGYQAGMQSNFAIASMIIFILFGILRLARFAIDGTIEGYYVGLPVSFSVIIPIVYFIFLKYNINLNFLSWAYLIPSFLMISEIKVKKP